MKRKNTEIRKNRRAQRKQERQMRRRRRVQAEEQATESTYTIMCITLQIYVKSAKGVY